jgi:hypothetical protein
MKLEYEPFLKSLNVANFNLVLNWFNRITKQISQKLFECIKNSSGVHKGYIMPFYT